MKLSDMEQDRLTSLEEYLRSVIPEDYYESVELEADEDDGSSISDPFQSSRTDGRNNSQRHSLASLTKAVKVARADCIFVVVDTNIVMTPSGIELLQKIKGNYLQGS